MGVRIDEDGVLIVGNCALPAAVVPAVEAFFRERFGAQPVQVEVTDEMVVEAMGHRLRQISGRCRCSCGATVTSTIAFTRHVLSAALGGGDPVSPDLSPAERAYFAAQHRYTLDDAATAEKEQGEDG